MKKRTPHTLPEHIFNESLWIFPPHIQETLPFSLSSTGITQRDPHYHVKRITGAEYYVLECILAGQGHLFVNGKHWRPSEGDVYLLPPGIPNEYYTLPEAPWEKIWFNISGELVEALVGCYGLDGPIYVQHAGMEELFRTGLELVRKCPEEAPVEFAAQMTRIIARLAELRRNEPEQNYSLQLAMEIRQYLDEHWREPYSLPELCNAVGKSSAQLMRIFKATFRTTPKQYHSHRKFTFATRYLENTDETIQSIALGMGFVNAFHFSTWFKKCCGYSPREFREESRTGITIS